MFLRINCQAIVRRGDSGVTGCRKKSGAVRLT